MLPEASSDIEADIGESTGVPAICAPAYPNDAPIPVGLRLLLAVSDWLIALSFSFNSSTIIFCCLARIPEAVAPMSAKSSVIPTMSIPDGVTHKASPLATASLEFASILSCCALNESASAFKMSTFFISCSRTRANSSFTAVTFFISPALIRFSSAIISSSNLRIRAYDAASSSSLLFSKSGGRRLIVAAFATLLVLISSPRNPPPPIITETDTAHTLAANLLLNKDEEGDGDDDDALSSSFLSPSLSIKGRASSRTVMLSM